MLLSHECRVHNGKINNRFGEIVYIVSVNEPKEGDKLSNYFEYKSKDEADGVLSRYQETLANYLDISNDSIERKSKVF